jgi:5'-3' exonuclease
VELERFVDATKASEFLNLRPRRLLQLARDGVIPAHPIGNGQRRVWRFRLSEIASALDQRAIKCTDAAVRTGKETR